MEPIKINIKQSYTEQEILDLVNELNETQDDRVLLNLLATIENKSVYLFADEKISFFTKDNKLEETFFEDHKFEQNLVINLLDEKPCITIMFDYDEAKKVQEAIKLNFNVTIVEIPFKGLIKDSILDETKLYGFYLFPTMVGAIMDMDTLTFVQTMYKN